MSTNEAGPRPAIRRLGHVALDVGDLDAMVGFYRDVLGVELVTRDAGAAFFRLGGDHHSLALFPHTARAASLAVLNHIALEVVDGRELRRLYRRLKAAGIDVGEGIRRHPTESFFASDPEGNRVELYADLFPGRDWTGVDYPGGAGPVDLEAD
jgi:catechol 2,3-dioxygenase